MLSSADVETATLCLAESVRVVAHHRRVDLERLRLGAASKFGQNDWFWEALLLSFGTMGNSRGAALVHNPQIHERVRFGALQQLPSQERTVVIEMALRAAKVRMPSIKTRWLGENFDRIIASGGPAAIKHRLNACPGMIGKTKFLMTFTGIGPKYARNLMMDVYHPDFRNSIAVDVRIKGVSARLGMKFTNYADEESFYLDAGHRAGLDGWEMDRLLYNFTAELVSGLESRMP